MNKMLPSNLYYGWLILAVCFFITICSSGSRASMGVFITPMESDLEWSRSTISRVLSLGILVGALSYVVIGYLHDKYGGRLVISVALVMVGISIATLSTVSSLPAFIFIYAFLGSFFSSGVSFVTIHSLLARWFFKRRGLVMSISAAGGSIGPSFFAIFSAYLIQEFDWRTAFIVLGAIVLVASAPLAAFFLRNEPSKEHPENQMPQIQDDKQNKQNDAKELVGPLFTSNWRQALSTSPFWQLSAAYLVCGITTNVISIHFVPFAEDQGVPKLTAATIFGVMMGLNAIGVLTAGALSQKYSQKKLLGTTYALRGVAYATLLTVGGVTGMWVFAVLAGMSWIATASMTSSLTADIYGIKNLGTLNGMSNMSHQIGGALSVLLAGELQGITGSYVIPFGIAGATLVFASILSFSIDEGKFSFRYNQGPASIFDPAPAR